MSTVDELRIRVADVLGTAAREAEEELSEGVEQYLVLEDLIKTVRNTASALLEGLGT